MRARMRSRALDFDLGTRDDDARKKKPRIEYAAANGKGAPFGAPFWSKKASYLLLFFFAVFFFVVFFALALAMALLQRIDTMSIFG